MLKENPAQGVKRYYDRNTTRLLWLSRMHAPKAIHQPLYVTKHMSLADALHSQHRELIAMFPETQGPFAILDLGCGVGETMLYLARNTPSGFKYVGITLSGVQAKSAAKTITDLGLASRVEIIEGDFHAIPTYLRSFDLAFAIESFIHSDNPSRFFSQAASALKPGGHLVIFDDFLIRDTTNEDMGITRDLKNGYYMNARMTIDTLKTIALDHHLEIASVKDFSATLRLHRTLDRLVHAFVPLARPLMTRSEYCRFLVGGDARQMAYKAGMLGYFMVVLVKREA